jgi:putative acetyltransferase
MSESKMDALFLAPECHRCGGGRRLVRHAQERKGELTVDVNEQNSAACRFYEACGFVVEGRSELDDTGRVPTHSCTCGWRRLNRVAPDKPADRYRDFRAT